MTRNTRTDVTCDDAWCNRVVAKQEDCYPTAPANKPINQETLNPNKPLRPRINNR